MSLLTIAWRNFCHRPLSSLLTTLSLALGVGLVVLVLSIFGIVNEAFTRNATFGYNLVVGPKGSALQLTLNSVFYLSQPIENLPYSQYMEMFPQAERQAMVDRLGGDPELAERDGKYAAFVSGGYAIPLALGDYYGTFRVVGTTTDFFEKLRHGPELDQPFEFEDGEAFQAESEANGFFEAVLGSRVAAEMEVGVGDVLYPTHGDPEGKGHEEAFMITGVLAPTGTPNDRAAFVNLEGFYLMEGHAKPIDESEKFEPANDQNVSSDDEGKLRPLTIPEREVTSVLIRTGNMMFAPGMQNMINESLEAQAAAPVGEIYKLMDAIVGPVMQALLGITLITCVVAAVGILVAIYNSMNDRRRDIAVMRALGARRETVTAIIVFESFLVAIIGGVLGWILAHAAIVLYSGKIEDQTGISVNFFTVTSYEIYILPVVLALALLAALLPAWSAYRTDVGSNLSA
ncbi:Macrolide export ATP-binding/permease protein MacB [Rubripirellula obstinata]|uniref:Macrolide export ATP-binding/permease protein MacB n=1 Tax=Rubripirellula obstinata TaxID=406547 RepID=A0A5B1CQ10_9BACT|nr:ABC transporter permease [Rubripirellula obstinata]KAA1261304.1 Macrolide export ATP-binding/permease protein MacB [Rubripirellula obstinata]